MCGSSFFFVCKKLSRKTLFIKLKNMTSSSKPFHWKLVGHYWTLLLKKIEDVPDCFQDSVANHLLAPSVCYLNMQLITFKQTQPCIQRLLVSQCECEPYLVLQPDQKSRKKMSSEACIADTAWIFNFVQLTQEEIYILPHIPCLPKYTSGKDVLLLDVYFQ